MYRAIPVASKACAERERVENNRRLRERIQKMRPQVDTTVPGTAQLEHLRNNLKREQLLEERYHTIDRENKILLQKMSDIMRNPAHAPRPRTGPPSLNRDARKCELMKITQQNHALLRRIQQAQPVYNHVAWEDSYKKSNVYLKNTAEYPLVLTRHPARSSSSSPAATMSSPFAKDSSPTAAESQAQGKPEDLKYVFKEGKHIGKDYFLVEMATDGRSLAISAFHGDQKRTLELVVSESNHRKLYRELNGDYSRVADKLRVQDDKLILDPRDGPLDSLDTMVQKKAAEQSGPQKVSSAS